MLLPRPSSLRQREFNLFRHFTPLPFPRRPAYSARPEKKPLFSRPHRAAREWFTVPEHYARNAYSYLGYPGSVRRTQSVRASGASKANAPRKSTGFVSRA